jgi:hypothetical protein
MYVRASFTSLFTAAKRADNLRENRRKFSREDTGEMAEIIVDLTGHTIECVVHNISDGGAMIEACINPLPERPILNYKKRGIRKLFRVVWSDGINSGIEFIRDEPELTLVSQSNEMQ